MPNESNNFHWSFGTRKVEKNPSILIAMKFDAFCNFLVTKRPLKVRSGTRVSCLPLRYLFQEATQISFAVGRETKLRGTFLRTQPSSALKHFAQHMFWKSSMENKGKSCTVETPFFWHDPWSNTINPCFFFIIPLWSSSLIDAQRQLKGLGCIFYSFNKLYNSLVPSHHRGKKNEEDQTHPRVYRLKKRDSYNFFLQQMQ